MMLFAIVFGLSMDYEVFLLSRVREEWHRTGDSRPSVADGLAATAGSSPPPPRSWSCVFGSFLLDDRPRAQDVRASGWPTAILLDATIVRMVLVPGHDGAARRRATGGCPSWLDRILPNIDVEGHA